MSGHDPALQSPEAPVAALRRLRAQIEAQGLCRKAPAAVLVELVACLALCLAGIALFLVSDELLLRVCGMLVSTAGSIGVATNTHTSSHQATSSRPRVNELLTYFGCPFFLGFSASYWWHKHLALHHPTPNVVGRDQDMDLWPWFALTEQEVSRARGLRRFYYESGQWLVFPFLVALNGFNMQRNGIAHLAGVWRERRRWRRAHVVDAAALLAHLVAWVGLPALYFPLPDVVGFYVLRIGLLGYAMFAVFAPGHYPAEATRVDLPAGRTDLALLQTSTTLNFRGGWLARLVCSGLDYQIEHHLFPGVPHTSYRRMSPLVRRFCLEQGLPYRSLPWGEALWKSWMVLRNPQRVARGLESLPLPAGRAQA